MSGLGISYPPPSEDVPIFDATLFNTGDVALTYNEAMKNFLAYPQAQGTENLLATNVAGVLTCYSDISANANIVMTGTANTNYIQFPDKTKQYTAAGSGGALTPNRV